MAITDLCVSSIEKFANGHSFGEVGPYVRIKGPARGALDPGSPHDAGIVDLDKAQRNSAGFVEYTTDIDILRPADPHRGSGMLVYDVPNRGATRVLHLLDDVPPDAARISDPKSVEDAGLAFTFGRGYSIVWSGWDPGAPRTNNNLGGDFPAALEDGKPIIRSIRDEFHFGTRTPADGSIRRLSYPAAKRDKAAARLTVRDRESDPRAEIPVAEWEFVDERTIRLLPGGRAFERFKIYEFFSQPTAPNVLALAYPSL